ERGEGFERSADDHPDDDRGGKGEPGERCPSNGERTEERAAGPRALGPVAGEQGLRSRVEEGREQTRDGEAGGQDRGLLGRQRPGGDGRQEDGRRLAGEVGRERQRGVGGAPSAFHRRVSNSSARSSAYRRKECRSEDAATPAARASRAAASRSIARA